MSPSRSAHRARNAYIGRLVLVGGMLGIALGSGCGPRIRPVVSERFESAVLDTSRYEHSGDVSCGVEGLVLAAPAGSSDFTWIGPAQSKWLHGDFDVSARVQIDGFEHEPVEHRNLVAGVSLHDGQHYAAMEWQLSTPGGCRPAPRLAKAWITDADECGKGARVEPASDSPRAFRIQRRASELRMSYEDASGWHELMRAPWHGRPVSWGVFLGGDGSTPAPGFARRLTCSRLDVAAEATADR